MVNKFGKWFPTRARFSKLTLGEKLKDTAGMMDALKMVAFDVFVHLPLIYFPSYYTCKEIVTSTSWNPLDWVKDGCTKYWTNKEDDLTAMIKLWGPSDCIQFSMPIHISMPFRHLVSALRRNPCLFSVFLKLSLPDCFTWNDIGQFFLDCIRQFYQGGSE